MCTNRDPAAVDTMLDAILAGQREILQELAALRAEVRQFARSRGEGAVDGAGLLDAIFALFGDEEFTTDELLAEVGDDANQDEGRAVRRALAQVGINWSDPRAGYRVGAVLRRLRMVGASASGLRLLLPRRNARKASVWRVVQDVGPATSGTASL